MNHQVLLLHVCEPTRLGSLLGLVVSDHELAVANLSVDDSSLVLFQPSVFVAYSKDAGGGIIGKSDRFAYRIADHRANKHGNCSRHDYFHNQIASASDCKDRRRATKRPLHSDKYSPVRTVFENFKICTMHSLNFCERNCST